MDYLVMTLHHLALRWLKVNLCPFLAYSIFPRCAGLVTIIYRNYIKKSEFRKVDSPGFAWMKNIKVTPSYGMSAFRGEYPENDKRRYRIIFLNFWYPCLGSFGKCHVQVLKQVSPSLPGSENHGNGVYVLYGWPLASSSMLFFE